MRRVHWKWWQTAAGVCAFVIGALACTDRTAPKAPARPPHLDIATDCAAAYTMITNEDDSLMAQYGMPSVTDTVRICENWNGSDYAVNVQTLGSSENDQSIPDTIQDVAYDAGQATPYDASGNQLDPVAMVAPSSFDLVAADSALRQASYDDPYYGVRASGVCDDPNSSCTIGPADCTEQIECTPIEGSTVASVPGVRLSVSVDRLADPVLDRRGVHRRGIRMLILGADELPRTVQGYRRFRRLVGADTVTLDVHPKFGLIMRQREANADGVTDARHYWVATANGFVRERTEIDGTERVNGRVVPSHAAIRIVGLTVKQ